jgi:hypothetical protein
MGRWKTPLSHSEIYLLESVLWPTLLDLGYEVMERELKPYDLRTRLIKAVYPTFLDAKLWCKTNAPLGRLVDTSRLRLEQRVT